jgi:tricorn protease
LSGGRRTFEAKRFAGAAYNPDGTNWGVENIGVIPDIGVEITPKDWIAGRDPQLEKAVQVAMEALKKVQPWTPKKPKYRCTNKWPSEGG